MNKFKSLTCVALLAITGFQSAVAVEFFDTSNPKNLFSLGVRVGLNTSNQTHNNNGMVYNKDSWGTGFDVGVVANINFKNYLTIQPGFFFESRSNNYSYMPLGIPFSNATVGHTRYTNFTIPIVASFNFNLSDNIRWSADFGPYLQFGLGGSDKGLERSDLPYDIGYYDNRNKFDIGLKMGTGLKFLDHYYIGVHYLAGFCDVWKNGYGGSRKSWTFTIGYDF